jgi:hypothetical protein
MTNATTLVANILAENEMTDADLLALRRAFGADMNVDAREADALFELDKVAVKPDGWADYFVLLLTTYLVHQGRPEGYINDAMAAWLIARIDHDGVVETETELRLLMNVLKVAEVPGDRLEAYALKQVEEAVMTGRGRVGQDSLIPGVIGRAEVELLRRIFYSVGGDGGMGISKMEAQKIFALNEATKGRDNDPEWKRFFVGAIANHLMMIAAPAKLDHDEARRRELWLNSDTGLGGSAGAFGSLSPRAIFNAFKEVFSDQSSRNPAETESLLDDFTILNEAGVQNAERITDAEADWLIRALTADGEIDENERALLEFIRNECPAISDTLRPLLDAA